MKARLVVSLLVISSVAVPLLSAAPAGATFPGTNGRIAYYDFLERPTQIHSIVADGTDPQQLTTGARAKTDPAWSADGSMIAFGSARLHGNARGRLEVMNADGTGRSIVVALDGRREVEDPAWSPDGSQIAFCRVTASLGASIWVVDVDGTDLTRLSRADDQDCYPDWSPDGSKIAFTSFRHGGALAVMDADGTNRVDLAPGFAFAASWSPDGSMIAFIRIARRLDTQEVFVVNADGSDRTRLTFTERRWEYTPAWSPDGSSIAFCKGTGPDPIDPCEIWIMDADGSNPTRITTTSDVDEFELSWQAT